MLTSCMPSARLMISRVTPSAPVPSSSSSSSQSSSVISSTNHSSPPLSSISQPHQEDQDWTTPIVTTTVTPALDPTPDPPAILPPIDPQLQGAIVTMIEIMSRHSKFSDRIMIPILGAVRTVLAFATTNLRPVRALELGAPNPTTGAIQLGYVPSFRNENWCLEHDQTTWKMTNAVSWPKGTTQRWYEPNLSLDDRGLPQFTLH